jgi:S1-C subfamily serine protease
VQVAAQPCDRPTRSSGLGVTVADGVVATAAHTVEGELRALTVDDVPATVAAIDPRTDLALLAVERADPPADLSTAAPDDATVLGPEGPVDVAIVSTGPLVVDDATDRQRYEREVHTFAPGVEDGTSGAPLVDDAGRVLGIVVLDNTGTDLAYAVTARELLALLAHPEATLAPTRCPD